MPREVIPDPIELYRQGWFPFDGIVSVHDLEEIDRAIADMEASDCIRPVRRMGG